jgi:hypothetical protein
MTYSMEDFIKDCLIPKTSIRRVLWVAGGTTYGGVPNELNTDP